VCCPLAVSVLSLPACYPETMDYFREGEHVQARFAKLGIGWGFIAAILPRLAGCIFDYSRFCS
jgi:hypothetical protein